MKKITQNGISFEYEYDSRGNIVSEKRGNLTTTYAYDALRQLIRVNDPHENATWVYNYDRGGNILSKVKYAYTTGTVGTALETIPYAYGDANWKDKLTTYNGTAITYDAIGNPLNDGSWTYEWAVGRQLKKMSRDGQSLTFKYDHNGMRIQKVLEHSWYPETTNYTYHGSMLTHMEVAYTDFDEVGHVDKLHFFYDVQSRPVKVRFNGTIYTYVHNLQGDIVGILDNNSNLVVEYKYDAWGKPLSTTGSLADTLGVRNPFRYRGYVYDEESGLYYLRSRYYTAHWNRFINSDEAFLAHNHFTYCANVPIHLKDEDGTLWQGAVHHLVQLDIQRRIPGMIREVSVIKATGGNGRIDLVLWQTGECWEIKPSHLYLAGCAQLTNYIRGEVTDKRWNRSRTPRRGGYLPQGTIITDEMIINYWYAGNGVILYDYIKYKKAIIPVPAYSPATEPVLEKEPVLLPNAVKPKYTIAEVPTCPFDFYAFEYDPGLLFAELFQVIIYGLA